MCIIASRLGGELLRYIRERCGFLQSDRLKIEIEAHLFKSQLFFFYYRAFDVIKEFLSIDFYVNYFQYNKIEIRSPCNKSRKKTWPRGYFFTGLGLSITSR